MSSASYDDNASASMMSTSELNGSSSSSRKRKSKSGSYFRVWSFKLIAKADSRHGNTTEEKGTLLMERLRIIGHACNESEFWGSCVYSARPRFIRSGKRNVSTLKRIPTALLIFRYIIPQPPRSESRVHDSRPSDTRRVEIR